MSFYLLSARVSNCCRVSPSRYFNAAGFKRYQFGSPYRFCTQLHQQANRSLLNELISPPNGRAETESHTAAIFKEER